MATAAPILRLIDEERYGAGLPDAARFALLEEDVRVARETVQRASEARIALEEELSVTRERLEKQTREGLERERILRGALRKLRQAKGVPEIDPAEVGDEAATILRLKKQVKDQEQTIAKLKDDITNRDKEIDNGLKAISRLQELIKTEQVRHNTEESTYHEGSAAVRRRAKDECQEAWRVAQGAFLQVEGLKTTIDRLQKQVTLAEARMKEARLEAETALAERETAVTAQERDSSTLIQAVAKEKTAREASVKAQKEAQRALLLLGAAEEEAERRRALLETSEKQNRELVERYILLQEETRKLVATSAATADERDEYKHNLTKLSTVLADQSIATRIKSAVKTAVDREVERILASQEVSKDQKKGKAATVSTPMPRRPPAPPSTTPSPAAVITPAKAAPVRTTPNPVASSRKVTPAVKAPYTAPRKSGAGGAGSDPRAVASSAAGKPYRLPLSPPPERPASVPQLSAFASPPVSSFSVSRTPAGPEVPESSPSAARTITFTELQQLHRQHEQQGQEQQPGMSMEEALLSSSRLFPSTLVVEGRNEGAAEMALASGSGFASVGLTSSAASAPTIAGARGATPSPTAGSPPMRFKTREERLAYEKEQQRAELTSALLEGVLPAVEMAVMEGIEQDLPPMPFLVATSPSTEGPEETSKAETGSNPESMVEITTTEVTVEVFEKRPAAGDTDIDIDSKAPIPRAPTFPLFANFAPPPAYPVDSVPAPVVVQGTGSAIVTGALSKVTHSPAPKVPVGKQAPKDRNIATYF